MIAIHDTMRGIRTWESSGWAQGHHSSSSLNDGADIWIWFYAHFLLTFIWIKVFMQLILILCCVCITCVAHVGISPPPLELLFLSTCLPRVYSFSWFSEQLLIFHTFLSSTLIYVCLCVFVAVFNRGRVLVAVCYTATPGAYPSCCAIQWSKLILILYIVFRWLNE